MSMKDVADALRKCDDYIVASHINMEGDALGSQMALYLMLKQMGKKAAMLTSEPVPERFSFMAHRDRIRVYEGAGKETFGTALLVDCPNIERTGTLAETVARARTKINIDHHISNNMFGDFNWVDPDASSCGEMIFRLCRGMNLNINEEMAAYLYVAIITDTGLFRYDSTTSHTHDVAADLLKLGVKPARIVEHLFERKGRGELDLLARSLATLTVTNGGRIAYMYVTRKMMEEISTTPDQTDGFVNYARSLNGAEISIFFREDLSGGGNVHVGFRSKGRSNVNMLASRFGGGGHPKASGCRLEGPLEDIIERVIKEAGGFLL